MTKFKATVYRNTVGLRFLTNIEKQTNDLYIVHCGHQKCPPGYTYNHKIPNEYHLHFVLGGKGSLAIDGQEYCLKTDDLFVIPKGCPIKYHADFEEPWEYIWITFDGTMAETYLQHAGINRQHPCARSGIPTKIYLPLVQKILNANELTLANEIRRVAHLFEIMALLIEAQSALQGGRKQYDYSSDAYVAYALQYIKANFDHIRVQDIVKYIGINRSYLTNIFKKKLGVSPQQYLLELKLEKGAELLRRTEESVQEIAAAIGYDNPLTFSKMFKKKYGDSPSAYRNQYRGKRESE